MQVSTDAGANWLTVDEVSASEMWVSIDVELSAFVGRLIDVRSVFHAVEPIDSAEPDVWRLNDVRIESDARWD